MLARQRALQYLNPSAGTWDWVSGSSTAGAFGVYGTQGVASASNMPGGRYAATGWPDSAGNLWLFGGAGNTSTNVGYLNDLWKYNIVAGTWEWVSGINGTQSYGVYGTQGVASSSNSPGARIGASAAVDSSGSLWLLGGFGSSSSDQGYLNDVWKLNPTAGTWEWVGGSNTSGARGVYGTRGVASPNNVLGGRLAAVTWSDSSGNLWLFGGNGLDSSGSGGLLNDLWEYTP